MEGRRGMSSAPVPKFASFRPKAQAPPSASETKDEISQRAPSEKHHGRISHRHDRQGRSPARSKGSDRHPETTKAREAAVEPKTHLEDFTLDVRGDEQNLHYGALHKYSVPSYRRVGYGNVLGLSLKQKIDRESSSDKRIVIPLRDVDSAVRSNRSSFAKVQRQRELRIKPGIIRQASEVPEAQADYLPFHGDGDGEEQSASEDDDGHYRSIEGKAKPPSYPEDRDLEYDLEQPHGDDGLGRDELRATGTTLSRKVETNPSDGQAWMDLVKHQALQYGGEERLTKAETQSLSDIRLSILEKAVKQVTDDLWLEQLLCELMTQVTLLWDTTKVIKKWNEMLSRHTYFLLLWTNYLDYMQTSFATFRFEDMRDAFAQALGVIRNTRETKRTKDAQLIRIQSYVLLRATCCMQECGFSEQAFGIWQANLEFNMKAPDITATQLKSKFEEYWESEVPRIGEDNYISWTEFFKNQGCPPDSRSDNVTSSSEDCPLHDWYSFEQKAEADTMPARTSDDTMEDDSYRVILFSDVEPFLIDVRPTGWANLLQAFFAFNSLPLPSIVDITDHSWWWDPFVRNDVLSSSLNTESMEIGMLQKLTPRCIFTSDTAFASSSSWRSAFSSTSSKSQHQRIFIRQILSTLAAHELENEELPVYYLAFEAKFFTENARRTAKRLLKRRPSSLRLYNAYALIEFSEDNRDSAEQVLATAINMSPDNPETVILWHTWIWELLERASPQDALSRLMTMPDSEIKVQHLGQSTETQPSSSAKVIRTRNLLSSSRDYHASLGRLLIASCYSTLHILFGYLSSDDRLSAAISVFNDNASLLPGPKHSLWHEILHQSLARLVVYHRAHNPSYSPRVVRPALQSSVSLFPQNTLLLSLFASAESQFRLDDRVRSTVSSVLHSPKVDDETSDNPQAKETVITHVFAVIIELSRSTEMGSNQHSIRAAFERGVQSDSGSKSAVIWQMYVLWELQQGGKARAVWWRAVRACPWVKALWVMPWQHQDLVGQEELKGIYELMMDKEIRIRVLLDD